MIAVQRKREVVSRLVPGLPLPGELATDLSGQMGVGPWEAAHGGVSLGASFAVASASPMPVMLV